MISSRTPVKVTEELFELVNDTCRFPWTRESLQKVIDLYQDGKTLRQITEITGVSYNTVRRVFKIIGVPLKQRGASQRLYTDEEEAFFLKCLKKGLSLQDLATLKGTTRHNMWNIIRKAKIRSQNVQSAKPAG